MMKYGARRLLSILLFTALAAQLAAAQEAPAPHYRAFDAKGNAVTLRAVVDSLERADVLFVGETHDNPVAHLLEA